jgi:hypothetical protein
LSSNVNGMRIRRALWLLGCLALATVLTLPAPAAAQENPISLDPNKGTLDGSPVDHLPGNIRLLDIQLPDGGTPMRADWSPDGRRLVFLDAPMGDVWEHELTTGATRNLTGTFLPDGVLRAHHLSNGDVMLCAPPERSADDPEGDRFRGLLWVLQRPLGTRPPVPLGEACWEGIAVSKHAGSTRIAWNQSTIDFTDVPGVFVEALAGESQVLSGRIVYGDDGTPAIADRTVVLDKRDVSPDTPAVEAQDFRSLDDGDADPDDQLIFSAYFHNGGQAMGVNLDTGAVTDFAPASPYYEEAEGADPAGRYVLVERDLTITLFPGMLDIWRLALDGSGTFERLTTFDYYAGFGANNPVVSPDGAQVAFGLKVEGEEGEGDGILLMDLSAAMPAAVSPTAAPSVAGTAAAQQHPATGATPALPLAGASLFGLAVLAGRLRRALQAAHVGDVVLGD